MAPGQIGNRRLEIGHLPAWPLLTAGLFLGSLLLVSLGGSDPQPIRLLLLLIVLVRNGLPVLGWLASAAGYGLTLWGALSAAPRGHGGTLQLTVGAGILMLLDWLLGSFGWLNLNTTWTVTALGWALWTIHIGCRAPARRRIALSHVREDRASPSRGMAPRLRGPLLAAPAVALLVGTACVAPGVLWQPSEVGGYDALEYHLQLPAEWARLGAIRGLDHNAYSYLPSLFEAAYMHLALWSGSHFAWAYSPQLLHAAMTLLAAAGVARCVQTLSASASAATLSAAAYLAAPWTIVTGSLAYNDQAMMAFGSAALCLALSDRAGSVPARSDGRPGNSPTRDSPLLQGLLTGLLCGLACLVKLTAAGMFVLPIAAMLLFSPKRWPLIAGFVVGCVPLIGLWAGRNYAWTGNPVFPMFANPLGTAHWTAEQATRWQHAHTPHPPLPELLHLLFSSDRGLLHPQFAFLLFPAALLGGAFGLTRPAYRKPTAQLLIIALLQLIFWLAFTHHQSRFLIPLLLPACILIGLAAATFPRPTAATLAVILIIAVATITSQILYLRQADGYAPQYLDAADAIAARVHPYSTLNALPPDAKIYAEGFATPFYIARPITYHTVWDQSPLGEPLSRGGPRAAAQWLREKGYTHVVIDWDMIELWLKPGNYGYDPSVRPDALARLASGWLVPLPDQPPVGPRVYRVKSD